MLVCRLFLPQASRSPGLPIRAHGATVSTWPAPSGAVSRVVPAEGVIHVRWHCDSARPWVGRSPLKIARLSAEVAAAAEMSMKNELAIKPTRIVPTPSGNREQVEETAAKFRGGGVRGVAWARQTTDLRADPKPEIMGPAPTQATVEVRRSAAVEVATACGIPPALIDPLAAGQGQRESYRRFALLTIAPGIADRGGGARGETRPARLAPGLGRARRHRS